MGGFRARSESARSGSDRHDSGRSGSSNKQRTSRPRTAPGRSKGYQQRRPEERQMKAKQHGSGDKVRDVVLHVLREVTTEDAYGNLVLPREIKTARLNKRDAAFATELTYGTLRASGLLDAVIAKAAGRPVDKIDSVVLDILRLGAYQILRTRVEDHAAVDTSVKLAKANGAGQASGFVNGVLRTITRSTPEQWMERIAPDDSLASLAVRTAHPEWIAAVFADALEQQEAGLAASELEQALQADDQRPTIHLAARPGQISAEELALVTGGEEGRWSPYAVYLDEGSPGELEPIRDGMASVQDEGSQLIALTMVRAPLQRTDRGRWLDLCAGPGGKTAFIASWAVGEEAKVDAVEVAEHRAKLVSSAVRDLPVAVHVGDGRKVAQIAGIDMPTGGFDRVLVDAPCSGLGALRRRPEARWRKDPKDVPPLVALQKELLRSALSVTAEGGVVVYSTCSPHPAETSEVVRAVAAETGATVLDVREILPELDNVGAGPFVQLWPHRHGTDAMFIAALRPASDAGAGSGAEA